MDYQEAIEALRLEGGLEIEGNLEKLAKFFDGMDTAIHALKEIQEYEKTGLNPNQVSEMIYELSETKRILGHYQPLGTLEEVREAVEKQKAKIPNLSGDGYFDGKLVYDTYECPNCGKEYEMDYEEHDYCPNCGQHIDWSE